MPNELLPPTLLIVRQPRTHFRISSIQLLFKTLCSSSSLPCITTHSLPKSSTASTALLLIKPHSFTSLDQRHLVSSGSQLVGVESIPLTAYQVSEFARNHHQIPVHRHRPPFFLHSQPKSNYRRSLEDVFRQQHVSRRLFESDRPDGDCEQRLRNVSDIRLSSHRQPADLTQVQSTCLMAASSQSAGQTAHRALAVYRPQTGRAQSKTAASPSQMTRLRRARRTVLKVRSSAAVLISSSQTVPLRRHPSTS